MKNAEYVAAAEALGSKPWRAIRKHGLPNIVAPIIILAGLTYGQAIVAEAALSFLGVGPRSPNRRGDRSCRGPVNTYGLPGGSWCFPVGRYPIASSSFNPQYRVAHVYQRLLTSSTGPTSATPKTSSSHSWLRAKELLAEAGFPDGFDTTLIATDRFGALYTAQTEWVVEDLTAVGINVELELLDYSTYFGSRWPDVEYGLQFGPQAPFLEPDEWLRGQMGTGQGRNWYNLSDPTLDALLEEQLGILDEEERAEKIREIQRYALTEVLAIEASWLAPTE